MKLGNFKIFIFLFALSFVNSLSIFAEEKIQSVPLINLEELLPTFEEDKDELEGVDEQNANLNNSESIYEENKTQKNDKIYVNIVALDKITAKTSAFRLTIGEKKIFWHVRNYSSKMSTFSE